MSELETKDIIDWIVNHTDDRRAMDTISNLVFPHTSRFLNRYDRHVPPGDAISSTDESH